MHFQPWKTVSPLKIELHRCHGIGPTNHSQHIHAFQPTATTVSTRTRHSSLLRDLHVGTPTTSRRARCGALARSPFPSSRRLAASPQLKLLEWFPQLFSFEKSLIISSTVSGTPFSTEKRRFCRGSIKTINVQVVRSERKRLLNQKTRGSIGHVTKNNSDASNKQGAWSN